MNKLSNTIATAVMASLSFGAISTSFVVLSATEVVAKDKKSKKAKKAKKAKPAKAMKAAKVMKGKGKLASELKNLNAMCANENAFANASPDSNIGRIGAYWVAYDDLTAAQGDVDSAQDVLDAAGETYDGAAAGDIAVAISELPAVDETDGIDEDEQATLDAFDALNRQLDFALANEALAQDQDAEQDALMSATKGRVLSDDALAALREGCSKT